MRLLRHRDTEALVKGDAHPHDASLVAVQSFLDDMRTYAATRPAPTPSPRLSATLDGRRPLRAATDPIPSGPHARRLRDARPFRPAAVAVAAGAMVFGGLATAGALPKPVQHTSAELGSHLGIHLPGLTRAEPDTGGRVDPGADGNDKPDAPQSRPEPKRGAATTTPSGPTTTTLPAVPIAPTVPATPTLPTASTLPGVPRIPSLPIPELPLRQGAPTETELVPFDATPPQPRTFPSTTYE